METLKYLLKKNALAGITNNVTEAQYRANISRFAEWAKKTHRIRLASDVLDSCALTQEYADFLSTAGYSPDTIHTYLAPVTRGLGLSMNEIHKPKRVASAITKTRRTNKNKQGQREQASLENARIVEAAKVIGVRREEMARLTGDCLVKDYAGNLCVLVRRGKGGKTQMQRILPKDCPAIIELFAGVSENQKVFDPADFQNKIPIHAIRRSHAQEAYNHYLHLIHEGHRQEIIDDLKVYFLTYHAKQPGSAGERRFAKQFSRFCADIERGNGIYRLRGENMLRAQQAGRPTEYDRVALMAVSVFHLAHWRNDVTARNYMV